MATSFVWLLNKLPVLIEQQFAGVVARYHAQSGALFLAQHLPRNDVRMVLELREDDLVAGADESATEPVHHQIDAIGGAAA